MGLGPFARIILRYGAGALVTYGFITADMGYLIAEDPDLVAIISLVLGAVFSFVAEYGYRLALKYGWAT